MPAGEINGRCQDCGRDYVPTRVITFWVNGMPYRVCREHEQVYRRVMCWPVRKAKGGA